jgi:hypothetical protein
VLKKTITYENFNGETVVEDFFFHLSKAELVEMEMSVEGGLSESLQKIVAEEDTRKIVEEFKRIILKAYGVKSLDGRRFIKNQQLREEFESTEAYSTLFMDLVTNVDAAIEFVNGIVPQGMVDEATKVVQTDERALASVPEEKPEPKILSKKDIEVMSPLEFAQLGARVESGEVKLAE